jgi:2-polyprenyl-3-methyl-5-hydroxy-6-metoxy-1,4-benzoquinol methylase
MEYRRRIYERYFEVSYGVVNAVDRAGLERGAKGLERVLRHWLPKDRSARILDAACGVGYAVHMLQRLGYANAEGVDVSPDQVRQARQWGLPVTEADALALLSSQPGSWDCILALDFVEHLTKDELFTFLDAARKALRPTGRLIVKTPNANSPVGPRARYRDLTHELIFTEQSLREAFLTCGLRVVEITGERLSPFTPLGWLRWLVAAAFRTVWRAWMVAELGREAVEMPLAFNLIGVAEPA